MNELHAFVDDRMEEDGRSAIGLSDFLQEVSLLSDVEHGADDNKDGTVSLMTIHAAKGLEFPVVFIVGLEENIFPSLRSCDSLRLLEEERRLLYVAITRAEEKCYLSCAKTRYRFGKTDYDPPSRFIKDIDARYIQRTTDDMDATLFGDNWRQQRASSSDFHQKSSQMMFGRRPASDKKENTYGQGVDGGQWFADKNENTGSRRLAPIHVSSMKRTSVGQSLANPLQRAVKGTAKVSAKGPAKGLSVGVLIDHQRFGRGEVLRIEGADEDTKVTVAFENGVGTKQLLVKFARFTIVKS